MTGAVETPSSRVPATLPAHAARKLRRRGRRTVTGLVRDAGGFWTVMVAAASGGTAWALGARPDPAVALSAGVVVVATAAALFLRPPRSALEAFVFTPDENQWTIGSADATFRLRNSEGLRYLHFLLRHPGLDFSVGEVHENGRDPVAGIDFFGDAGAESEYRRRRRDLEREIQEVELELRKLETEGDHEGAWAVQQELTHKRWALLCLDVTTALWTAISGIAGHHLALAQHLHAAVRTDPWFSYASDSAHTPEWEL